MPLNTFEIIIAVIVCIAIGGPILLFLIGYIKGKLDETSKGGNSGKIGWIIALVIGIILFVVLFKTCTEPSSPIEYRHT